MKSILQLTEGITALLQNTHLSFCLQGWPAALTAVAVCGAGVAIYAIKATHPGPMPADGPQAEAEAEA